MQKISQKCIFQGKYAKMNKKCKNLFYRNFEKQKTYSDMHGVKAPAKARTCIFPPIPKTCMKETQL